MFVNYFKRRFCNHKWEMYSFIRGQSTEFICDNCGKIRTEAWRVTYPDRIKIEQLNRRQTDKQTTLEN